MFSKKTHQITEHIYITIGHVCLYVRPSVRPIKNSTPSHGRILNLSPFLESSRQGGGNKIIWKAIGAEIKNFS